MLNIFKKSQDKNNSAEEETLVKITSLLIHAAKIDENYSEKERLIIINFLKSINSKINFENVMKKAETEEENSNQIFLHSLIVMLILAKIGLRLEKFFLIKIMKY